MAQRVELLIRPLSSRAVLLSLELPDADAEMLKPQRRTVSFNTAPPTVFKLPSTILPTPPYLLHQPAASRVFILAGQSNMVGRADPAVCWDLEPPAGQIWWHNDSNFDGGDSSDGYVPIEPQHSSRRDCDHWGPEAGMWLGGGGGGDCDGGEAGCAGERCACTRDPSCRCADCAAAYGTLGVAPPEPSPDSSALRAPHLVKFAMGSTRIREHWSPEEGEHWAAFVETVRRAVAAAPQPARVDGLFWLQGESDTSSAGSARAHGAELVALVRALRLELHCPDLPFVCGHVVWPAGRHVALVNEGLSRACDDDGPLGPYATCVSAEGASVTPDGHLDTRSVLAIGRRMSDAYWALVSGRARISAAPPPPEQAAVDRRPSKDFDDDEVDVHGGDASADDLMTAFGF
jgi:hypothetical protein